MGKKVFLIDVARCTGCDNCQLACKDEHVKNDWAPIARPQPDIGHFWMKKQEEVCGTVPKVRVNYLPTLCNHCDNAKCMEVCPTGAAYRNEDGFVIFDTEKCNGCRKCMEACPYGVIYFNDTYNIAQKCTGCAHLLDNGYKVPRCVEVCPTDAIRFGDEEDLAEELEGTQVLKPESGCMPRVHYRNLPGKFIAGTVYDPEEKEVLIGAKIRLQIGGKRYTAYTDDFGDFWFNDLAVGRHDLYVDADGYETYVKTGIHTRECVNVGDIPMKKKDPNAPERFSQGGRELDYMP